MRIYFVRHGQTKANIEQYAQGPEEPLDEVGLRQAGVLAQRCRTLEFETIITSDMVRAQQTAETIAQAADKPIETEALLREVSLADVYSGPPNRAQAEKIAREIPDQLENEGWFTERGMESYRAVQNRAQAALTALRSRTESSVMVVTHGTILKFILAECLLGGMASSDQLHAFRSRLRVYNTGITVVDWKDAEERWEVCQVNDINHFAE